MTHRRIRPFNTRDTYPEQDLDNDLCQAVVAGDTVFLRGQVGQDLETSESVGIGDPAAQAEQAMANIAKLLDEAGSRLEHVVKVVVYLVDVRHGRRRGTARRIPPTRGAGYGRAAGGVHRRGGARPPRPPAGHGLRRRGEPAQHEAVLDAMVARFGELAGADLGDRLVAALAAGETAGGEGGHVRSAAVLMVGDVEWPVADLRVDWADAPVDELEALWAVYRPQLEDYVARALDPAAAPGFGVPGE